MKLRLTAVLFLFIFVAAVAGQTPFTFNEMLAAKRVGDPQVAPDGRSIAFTIGVVNKDANRTATQIYTMRPDGSEQRQITSGDKSSSSPRWSPDGRHIAYVSGGQIWRMDADGDNKKQITNISTGASNPVWSPDGKWIAFGSEVYPECTSDDCNKKEDARVESSKVQAKVTDRLLYRHWVEWRNRKRSHVFVIPSSGGVAADFTAGDFDSPPYAASSGTDYAFSPNSKELAFLKNPDKV